MRLELHTSGGTPCPECEAYPLIKVIRNLDEDPVPLFGEFVFGFEDIPWYRPLKRRWQDKVRFHMECLEASLIDLTKFPIAQLPHEVGEEVPDRG